MRMRKLLALSALAPVLLLAACGGGSSSSPPPAVTIFVSPLQASVPTNGQQPFRATVSGTSNTAVNWSVSGSGCTGSACGTIRVSGLYTAPASVPSPPGVTVTAVSQADTTKSATATETIISPTSGNLNRMQQTPPIELGTSGGNANDISGSFCCSGTLGALVSRSGIDFILSNNHDLARRDQAMPGEPITQPGLVDTNCHPAQVVANFTQAAPLGAPGNKPSGVDAAIAQIVSGMVDMTGAILELGPVVSGVPQPAPPASTPVTATIGESVAKSGRTTGLTCANIQSTNTTASVQYQPNCNSGTPFSVNFNNQIVVNGSTFSAAGDSGALIIDSNTAQPVALLFAGNTTSTLGNPIQTVLNALPDPNTGAIPAIVGGAQRMVAACPGGFPGAPVPGSGAFSAVRPRPSDTDVQRATTVKEAHVEELMSDPAVFGVGVGAADDNPAEPVVVIYVEPGKPHRPIPPQLNGVRTKVISTDRFRAYGWNENEHGVQQACSVR